jgi:hypothetical protein
MVGANVDHIAVAEQIATTDLESGLEWVPHPRRCHQHQNRRECGSFIPALTVRDRFPDIVRFEFDWEEVR